MLIGRGGAGFTVPRALFWSASWAVGAAIGVALGAWLTIVGGSGAPGAAGLDVGSDIVVWPAAAFGSVFVGHFVGQVIVAALRGRAAERGEQ